MSHYLLSIAVSRPKGVCLVELYDSGKVIKSKSGSFLGDNIKKNALRYIHRGLRMSAPVVSHEDVLCIEVRDPFVATWVRDCISRDDYNDLLDMIFSDINELDCQWRIVCGDYIRAENHLDGALKSLSEKTESTVCLDDAIQDLEGN